MNTIQLNINNLTSLWEIACEPFKSFYKIDEICYCSIANSEWPNRIWTAKTDIASCLIEVRTIIEDNDETLTFSYFDTKRTENKTIVNEGFSIKSVQYGMSLLVAQTFTISKKLEFRVVKNERDAALWSTAFQQAFGYTISTDILLKTIDKIPYTLIFYQTELVGTIIFYKSQHTAGVHSLGIIPSMRKQGFATEIMYHILNKAYDLEMTIVTLQASEMAKNMYKKIGFSTDFIMQNYQLNK
ncbi:GNAT family N-acetyltransferase [Aquimarina longa]|uniref:GNAT family N-acetyltransferase n=1 Tax=Aquimarina longa TaxID=1080221 RepID=UPI000782D9DF|nr:GNAT family N-acetyltransferase [Aquimarina longa]